MRAQGVPARSQLDSDGALRSTSEMTTGFQSSQPLRICGFQQPFFPLIDPAVLIQCHRLTNPIRRYGRVAAPLQQQHHRQGAQTPTSCVASSLSSASPSVSQPAYPLLVSNKAYRAQLVETLLYFIGRTKDGTSVNEADSKAIDAIIDQLSELGSSVKPYTSDRMMYDDYVIVYSAPSDRQKSPPVGGLLRSSIGRLIFQSAGTFEHLVAANTVVQLLCFRFLGILPGCVALKGRIEFTPQSNDVTFQFQSPRLCIASLVFQYGARPRISTSFKYVDERIRIMQGRRGSRFVFVRRPDGQLPVADKWKYVYNAKPLPTILLPILLAACVAAAAFAPVNNVVRLGVIGFMSVVAWILKRGGGDRRPVNTSETMTASKAASN